MKHYYLLLLFFAAFLRSGQAQISETPCTLQADINVGICIDFFCIPLYSNVSGGTPPYQYQWFNGSPEKDTYLNFGTDPNGLDTCLTLQVTDFQGCVAFTSVRYVYNGLPGFLAGPDFLQNDTLLSTAGGTTFSLQTNDHPYAQNYTLVEPPKHGTVTLNPDGSGQYTPSSSWCGPDYFRYTAADTSGCNLALMATVWIEQATCAGILLDKTDCNQDCNGQAAFYQNGVLTPPLSFNWSNGSTLSVADQLCAGPVSLTVTDALGQVQTYNASINSSTLEASIAAPLAVCNSSLVALSAVINTSNIANYKVLWTGTGIYGPRQFASNLTTICSSNSDSSVYQLMVRSEDGCVVNASKTLEVYPLLSFNLKTTLPECPGDTLEIRPQIIKPGAPPYSYIWSGPKGVQSNWSILTLPDCHAEYSGRYDLTLTDQNGCTAPRASFVTIPDTCEYAISLNSYESTYCTGSEIQLFFGLSPNFIIPENISWSGPVPLMNNRNFVTLSNADPSMTGWYFVAAQMGDTELKDSIFITVNPDVLSFNSVTVTPPTECFSLFDGQIKLEMSAPPPYSVRYLDSGPYQNVNTNPIVRNGVNAGYFTVLVKKNGCVSSKYITVEAPDSIQVTVQDETCAGGDGQLQINSPHLLTTSWQLPDGNSLFNQTQILNAQPGHYLLYAKDETTNCVFRDTLLVRGYLDFAVTVLDTPTCLSNDGSLLGVPLSNVNLPATYVWSNGFNGNPAENLATGGYSLTLTDVDGCSRHKNTVLPAEEACIAQITGRVYVDTLCLCVVDSQSVIFPFVKICATNGSQTACTYANNNGEYALALTEPGLYTITASTYLHNVQTACTEFEYQVGQDVTQDTTGINFFFCASPQSDLQTMVFCGNARPGFDYNSKVMLRNNGIWTADTTLLSVVVSPYISNPVFSPSASSYDPASHLATWKIPKLKLYQQFQVNINGVIDAAIGDTLRILANAWAQFPVDLYSENNSSECAEIVSGSYDPNDKKVNPLGLGADGNIAASDSVLTYTIRFQNTGTDTAFTVVLRDTLDADVYDLNSITPLFSSHPYHLRIENGNILVFSFDPIILLNSARSESGSKGFVQFSLELKDQLPSGTVISNSAAIYFDYNEPVLTEPAVNTLVQTLDPETSKLQLALSPNPSADQSWLSIDTEEALQWMDISLVRLDGQLIQSVFRSQQPASSLRIQLDTSHLPAGMYVVWVKTNLGQGFEKLVVMHR